MVVLVFRERTGENACSARMGFTGLEGRVRSSVLLDLWCLPCTRTAAVR